jgi:hypothetical protein
VKFDQVIVSPKVDPIFNKKKDIQKKNVAAKMN